MIIKGYYLDGVTSARYDAFIEASSSSLTLIFKDVKGEQNEIPLSFARLVFTSRLGNTPREIAIDECQIFVTHDNDAVDQLLSMANNSSHSVLYRLESKLSLVLVSTLVTVALVWSFVIYGIPASAKYVADRLPKFATQQFGSSLNLLDRSMFEPSQLSAKRQQQIQTLAAPYLKQYKDLGVQLHFRSGMPPNALALPSGDIVFTDAFVKLTENDQELVAVLFHEIGHLKHKHMTRRVLQDSFFTLMIVLISGDVDSIDILTGIPTLIVDLSWSREFETEADRFALESLHQQSIPLHYFADIMARLAQLDKAEICEDEDQTSNCLKPSTDHLNKKEIASKGVSLSDFLSTHPATDDRIKMTQEMINYYQSQDQKR